MVVQLVLAAPRTAQLTDLYKNLDIKIKPIRGNIDTRIKKLDNGEYDAIVLAEAGLKALGITRTTNSRYSAIPCCRTRYYSITNKM